MTEIPALMIYATYRLVPDDVEAFRSLASRMATAANAHEGCVFLDVAQDICNSATFRLIEGWRDQAALNAHLASEEFRAVLKDASMLGVVDRSADIYSIGGSKPLEISA